MRRPGSARDAACTLYARHRAGEMLSPERGGGAAAVQAGFCDGLALSDARTAVTERPHGGGWLPQPEDRPLRRAAPLRAGEAWVCLDVLAEQGLLRSRAAAEDRCISALTERAREGRSGRRAGILIHLKEQKAGKLNADNQRRTIIDSMMHGRRSAMRPTADHGRDTERRIDYADGKHKNQLRKSGEPYIIHPLAVAEIVAEIGLDTDAIVGGAAARLSGGHRRELRRDLRRLFGETVAELVEGVTKLTRVQYSTTEEQQMENLRKMFMAMSKDIRVILIKIADRLHNMRTHAVPEPGQAASPSPWRPWRSTRRWRTASACRRSSGSWRTSRCSYLDPEGYQEIIDYLEANAGEQRRASWTRIQSQITERLADGGHPRHRSTAASSTSTPSTARCTPRTRPSTSSTTSMRSG